MRLGVCIGRIFPLIDGQIEGNKPWVGLGLMDNVGCSCA
jgi:hypothetical protein